MQCGFCGCTADMVGHAMKACGKCQVAFYCSRSCQAKDWKQNHKRECAELQSLHQSMRGKVIRPHVWEMPVTNKRLAAQHANNFDLALMNVEKALRSIGLQDITVRDRAIGARKIKEPFQVDSVSIFSITAGGHKWGKRGWGGWTWKRENAEGLPVSELLGRILDLALRERLTLLTSLGFSPPIQRDELPSMKMATDAAASATALVGSGGLRKPLARRVLSFLRGRTHAQGNSKALRSQILGLQI